MPKAKRQPGIYLLHFEKRFGHAQHYLGATRKDIVTRVCTHLAGSGVPLVRHVVAAGIKITIARVWKGASFADEARLKRWKKNSSLCPICNPKIKQHLYAGQQPSNLTNHHHHPE